MKLKHNFVHEKKNSKSETRWLYSHTSLIDMSGMKKLYVIEVLDK